jgi:hypothetical protein
MKQQRFILQPISVSRYPGLRSPFQLVRQERGLEILGTRLHLRKVEASPCPLLSLLEWVVKVIPQCHRKGGGFHGG